MSLLILLFFMLNWIGQEKENYRIFLDNKCQNMIMITAAAEKRVK
jgi:hypothetical protein